MLKALFALAAFGALASCSASATPWGDTESSGASFGQTPIVAATASGLRCALRLTPTPAGVRVEGLAWAEEDFIGEYELVVTKVGRSGSSDVSQGGPVDLDGSGETRLSATEISSQRGDQVRARLSLFDAGAVVCVAERSA